MTLKTDLMAAFFSRVARGAGCWLWTGPKDRGGYGTFSMNGTSYKAHRYSWAVENGPIPKGLMVCHRCDVPSCVNPAHLFLGTGADNMNDAIRKGRSKGARAVHVPTLEVLKWIAFYQDLHGYLPTVRDICRHFGWAGPNSASYHLEKMKRRGWISAANKKARAHAITPKGRRAIDHGIEI